MWTVIGMTKICGWTGAANHDSNWNYRATRFCRDAFVPSSGNHAGKISAGWQDKIEEREEGDVLLVRITTEDGWNELAINDEAGTAVMHDADCSFRKDCTVMRAIGDGGSVITCIPHALKVLPLKGEDYSTPSIG